MVEMKMVRCAVCNGSGKVQAKRYRRRIPDISNPDMDGCGNVYVTCHGCNGKGQVAVKI